MGPMGPTGTMGPWDDDIPGLVNIQKAIENGDL